jgi:tetratricopeptide (TPR) repeat protein
VTSGAAVRTIYFDRGFIVFTASNSLGDRLGECLIEAGRITEQELDVAASLMNGKKRIGEAIVEAGYLTRDELGSALANQARKVATSLFALEEGMYKFEERECPIPLELRLSLSLYRIQLEGIRLMTSAALIDGGLPAMDGGVRLSKCPPFSFEEVRFLPVELLVMEAAQKGRSLEAILERVARSGKPRGIVLRTVYGLLSAGILERAEEGRAPAALKVQEEFGTFLLSKLDDDLEVLQTSNVRQEVLLEFENSQRASAQELLAVDGSAAPEVIEKAYEDRRAAWAEKQKTLENEKTLFLKVDEIQKRLERAKAELLESKAPSPDDTQPVRVARTKAASEELKRLLREIKLRKMVEDDEGTISLLYEVVALEPESAKYEAMLAQALASHPVMKNKAERHFRRALSLDPQNAEAHYLLGRYYQSFDMRSRALAEFKAALAIDPRLAQARSALVELKAPDGGIQDKLKRLFV